MILKRRVALNGVQLDSLDNRILISGFDEAAGRDTIGAVNLGAGDGQRITGRRRETLDVTIKFNLNIQNNNMAARDALLDKINAWAAPGGILTAGHKTGKRLNVVLAQAPGGGDQFFWSNEFTLVFRAYAIPFWENIQATSQALTQSSTGEGTLTMPGSTDTVAEVLVQNKSGATINDLTLTVNNTQMIFTGLGLANNGYFTLDHHLVKGVYALRARIGDASKLNCMSGDDELILHPGANEISYSAGGAVIATFSARGRYQ